MIVWYINSPVSGTRICIILVLTCCTVWSFFSPTWSSLSIFFCQISGRLFSDSGPRRSTRLAGDSGANTNANTMAVAGNGTNSSSKYLGSSKLSSVSLRTVTVRKGQFWSNENIEEGSKSPFSSLVLWFLLLFYKLIF